MIRRIMTIIATLAWLLVPVSAQAAQQYDPLNGACNGSGSLAQSSTTCNADGKKNPLTGPDGLLKKISLVLSIIAGIVAVVIIIVAGLQMVLSGGDVQKVASARSAIIGSVVGLVIITASEALVIFVINKL